jgi:hypothetical protein
MEHKVFKYDLFLGPQDKANVVLPKGAKPLHVDFQHGFFRLWAEIDPDITETETRTFEIFGTGHPMYTGMGVERKHINTFLVQDGTLVFHAYERIS